MDQFNSLSAQLIFGKDCKELQEKKICTAQSLSGTGSLRVAGEFIATYCNNKTVWVSNPTWGNHHQIFGNAGCTVKEYRYYDNNTRALDFKGLMEDLEKANQGDTSKKKLNLFYFLFIFP